MTELSSIFLQPVVRLKAGVFEDGKFTERESTIQATGFLYGYPGLARHGFENGQLRLWLVTCAHVVKKIDASDEHNAVLVKMNKSGNLKTTSFGIPLSEPDEIQWYSHPNMDIAVIKGSPQILERVDVEWEAFQFETNALTKSQFIELKIIEGEEVLMAGFPTGWREGRNDYPIVRFGVLAQIQGWLNDDHETLLVDGSGFPGNSGGPVFIKMTRISDDKRDFMHYNSLIGMVSESTLHPILKERSSNTISESADLVEVIPVDAINDTIQMAMDKEG